MQNKIRSISIMHYLFLGIYVVLSVSGLVLFKLGSKQGFLFDISCAFFSLKVHWLSIIGLIFYALSFLIYMGLIVKSSLSQLIPIATGLVYLSTLASAVIVFKENIQGLQILGSAFILFGVVLMNYK